MFLLLIQFTTLIFATIPEGYYTSLNGKQAAALKTELHNILLQDTSRYYSYGSGVNHTWNGFYYTDRNPSNNLLLDMYSNELRYFSPDYVTLNYPSFGTAVHIEHCVPKSWWGSYEWAAYRDLNNLYPADGSTNLSKSNNPLGVVSGTPTKDNGLSKIGPAVYDGYVGAVFEPGNEYKGDFARTYFYMATAYEHYANVWATARPENMMQNNTYPVFKPWALELLLQWDRQDPVSERELTRVEKVYSIQGNRNPFIDNPELIEYIWGNKVGSIWNISTTIQHPNSIEFDVKFNSVQNYFTVNSESDVSIVYTIYTSTGQRVYQDKSYSNTQIQIPVLNPGVYIIDIYTTDLTYHQVQKFILR